MDLIEIKTQLFKKRRLGSNVVIALLACVFIFSSISKAFADFQSVCMDAKPESSMMHDSSAMEMDHSSMDSDSKQNCCNQADMENCNNSCNECVSSSTALSKSVVAGLSIITIAPSTSRLDNHFPFINTPPLLRPPVIS
jgi:ABC-type nickel/cobalt efflux system permease component RcnA